MAAQTPDQRRQPRRQLRKASFPGAPRGKPSVLHQPGANLVGHRIVLGQKAEQGIGRIEAPNDHDDECLNKELVGIGFLSPTLAFGGRRCGGGVGICSTSQSRLTRILPWVSISVPPEYEVWSLKYFRGSRAQVKTSARLSH